MTVFLSKLNRLARWTVVAVLLIVLAVSGSAMAAIADFCWTGFFVSPVSGKVSVNPERIYPVFRKYASQFEDGQDGAIYQLLRRLEWDEMTFHGYVGLAGSRSGQDSSRIENLASTYGFFLAIDQILPFEPDKITVFENTYSTFTTYLFGSLNLFNLDTRNLIYSRPFFVTHQGKKRLSIQEMAEFAILEFIKRLKDPADPFTKKMTEDLQNYFGERGEQKEAIRMISGALTDTYGVMPVCEKCVRTTLDDLSRESIDRLRDFSRLYFNVMMSRFKQVVMVPERQSEVRESTHTFVVNTKEGDVVFVESDFSGYDEGGRTQLRINVPEPINQVKLGIRYVVEQTSLNENAYKRQYNTLLDILVNRANPAEKKVHSLTNQYEKTLTGSRITSDVYYFNSLINAFSGFDEKLF